MGDGIFIYLGVSLLIAACLAFIPASIAKNKGYSFGLWWIYGWMLFIVAIIHVIIIPDKHAQPNLSSVQSNNGRSAVEELKSYKELLDDGVITEEEFLKKKEQLLKMM